MAIFDFEQLIIDQNSQQQNKLIGTYLKELCASNVQNFQAENNCFRNNATKIAIYCKIAGRLKKTKNSRRMLLNFDKEKLYVTKAKMQKDIRSFFNAFPHYKLLVNVVGNEHTMALFISRNVNYNIQMYNCNHNADGYTSVLDLFGDFKPRDNLIRTTTRTLSNYDGFCLAYTWCYMYNIFMGSEKWQDKPAHRWYGFNERRQVNAPPSC